jgi:predicted phosphodiesterase
MVSKRVRETIEHPERVTAFTSQEIRQLLEVAEGVFEREAKLIEITPERQVILVGDTHGDFDATKNVIHKYLRRGRTVVFLGDYVDRGKHSMANLNYLLSVKLAHPDEVFLLQGNHEGYGVLQFSPADFWQSLDHRLREEYARVLLKLPLAVSADKLIALHGALPNIRSLSQLNEIAVGGKEWRQVTWGDWQTVEQEDIDLSFLTGRPQFDKVYFDTLMSRFGKSVLVRSHQPDCPQVIYDRRCLTIFTSHAYVPTRTIAIADLGKEINTVDDLTVELV